jgi:RNA polymerase sigma factor (sigma-70 family)
MPSPPKTSQSGTDRPPPGGVAVGRLSDRALFARAAADEAAFAEIVRRYREPLRRHAARYVGDADAEDVVQQALVNASLSLRREPGREIEPRPWLYRVTTNAAIDHRRARAVRPLGDRTHSEPDLDALSAPAGSDPHEVIAGRETVRSIVDRIRGLSPNQRRAATARFLEGRSHDEIAGELGVSKGAARELIHRARRNLRETIPALSPMPLLVKLREAISGVLAGTASSGTAAKLAAGAAVAVVAAGGGGAALIATAADDDPSPQGSTPSAPSAAAVKSLKGEAGGRRDGGGAAAKNGKEEKDESAGKTSDSDSGSGSGEGTEPSVGSGDAPPNSPGSSPPGVSASPAAGGGGGGSSGPVQDLADGAGLGEVTDQLGLPQAGEDLGLPQVTEPIGVEAPKLPKPGDLLGGGDGLLGGGDDLLGGGDK